MKKFISKNRAEGSLFVPTSKSVAHRLLISAALCDGETCIIRGITPSEDVLATIDCLSALGVKIDYSGDVAVVSGIDILKAEPSGALNCRESGSTLRFLIPVSLLCGKEVEFIGSERLLERPLDIYERLGINFGRGDNRLAASGNIIPGEYRIPGDVSSQFITGLIFALSTLGEPSRIIIEGRIESRPYIDLTLDVVKNAKWENENTIIISGKLTPYGEITVEGDWSAAAFPLALNHLGGNVTVKGLNSASSQGDKVCTELFDMISRGYCEINIENTPDLGPILFTLAAAKQGAKFVGTKRLKIKESDRALAMKCELEKFGAELIIEENSVTVLPRQLHAPSETLCGHNDHRIVMSLAVLCSLYGGEIDGCEAVKKSYPSFFEDINKLGILTYDT